MRHLLTAVAIALAAASSLAHGAVELTERTQVNLLRSSTTVATLESWDACVARATELAKADARTSGTVTYTCQTERRQVIASYSPNVPTCPAKPADQARAGTCPSGTTGSWQQVLTHISAPAPTCWTPSAWTPANPPAGACVPVPTSAALTAVAASPTEIAITWTGLGDGTGFELQRCVGANCADFATICHGDNGCDAGVRAWTNGNVDSGQTYRYRIREYDAQDRPREWSPIVDATTIAAPAPTGRADITLTPPTRNTDGTALTDLAGYRLSYGTSPSALVHSIDLPTPGAVKHTVEGLAPGTWYFGAVAYTSSGGVSALSNIESKIVTQ